MEAKIKSLINKMKKTDPKDQEVVLLDEEGVDDFFSLDESIVDERAPTIQIQKARAHKLPTLNFDKNNKKDKNSKSKPQKLKTLLKQPTIDFLKSPR